MSFVISAGQAKLNALRREGIFSPIEAWKFRPPSF